MGIHIVVLAKQVPDTQNVTGDAMKEDGTVNRAALPAIFNPEDLNALEMALEIKEMADAKLTVITMGPPKAADILKDSLYRGADQCFLLTDRKFAGADTLATSYVLAEGVKTVGAVDIVLCGRQAIDGDTAQIGPQVAQKLGLSQVTYAEKVLEVSESEKTIRLERQLGRHRETIDAGFPVLLTVNGEANEPRPANAKRLITHKNAEPQPKDSTSAVIRLLSADDLGCDPQLTGLKGSPTKVKNIESVVLSGNEMKTVQPEEEDIRNLIDELKKDHVLL